MSRFETNGVSLALILPLIVRKEHSQSPTSILTCLDVAVCDIDTRLLHIRIFVICLFPAKSRISEEGLTICNLGPKKVGPFFGFCYTPKCVCLCEETRVVSPKHASSSPTPACFCP